MANICEKLKAISAQINAAIAEHPGDLNAHQIRSLRESRAGIDGMAANIKAGIDNKALRERLAGDPHF